MTFRVGQKVVFIGPDLSGNSNVLRYMVRVPKPRQVYTVRAVIDRRDGLGCLLAEIVNRPIDCGTDGLVEVAINIEWLRPVAERKTDITVFTEILRKASKPARGPVVASPQSN